MAVPEARLRIIALSSLVATTATVFFILSVPIVSSRNSRTSRPRSPTRAMTTVSKAWAAANMASSVDLPTPEPANTPMRWPKHSGVKMSITLTPVRKEASTRCRDSAGGVTDIAGLPVSGTSGAPPSTGWPSASTTRPFHETSGPMRNRPRRNTGSAMPASKVVSNGATRTLSALICTTSPAFGPWRPRCSTMSPSLAAVDNPPTL
jgi:hypothetical protein